MGDITSGIVDRRSLLVGGGLAITSAVGTAAGRPAAVPVKTDDGDHGFVTPAGPYIDRERAAWVMKTAGVDALIAAMPLNIYHATGALSVVSRFTQHPSSTAIIPRDLKAAVAFVADGSEFFSFWDSAIGADVECYTTGGGAGGSEAPIFPQQGPLPLDRREQWRQSFVRKSAPFSATFADALRKALATRKLDRAVLGCDSSDAIDFIAGAAPHTTRVPVDDIFLHIRLIKSPAELAILRAAASANVEAGLDAIRGAAADRAIRPLRQRFFSAAAEHGNVGVYANIDLNVNETSDGPLFSGQAFMVDFVSHLGFYQGDFGRTVFLGEPRAETMRAVEIGARAWGEIRSRLRPGLAFSEIPDIGMKVVGSANSDLNYAFHPHTVGLQHWDHPLKTIDGRTLLDLRLEAGMVVSVDCPLLVTGYGGTSHLEDLVVITETGAELLHAEVPAWFIV